MALVRKLLIRTVFPLNWSLRPKRIAQGLQRFGNTESDSAWQILYALDVIDDPKVRCMVLQHAFEEVHHGVEFPRVAKPYVPRLPYKYLPERNPLFQRDKGADGLADFLAYAHVGEMDVFDQFDSYAAGIGSCDAQSVFREAKLDEDGHVGLTWDLLVVVTGSEKKARRKVLEARAKRIWEVWLRLGKSMGEIPLHVILSSLYLVFGLICVIPMRRRLAAGGRHDTRDNRIAIGELSPVSSK